MATKDNKDKEKGTIEYVLPIVTQTVLDTQGVASFQPAAPIHQGVLITNIFGNVEIEIYVNVFYGVNIPELSWDIQENVKKALEEQTSLKASHINIHIEGVDLSNVRQND